MPTIEEVIERFDKRLAHIEDLLSRLVPDEMSDTNIKLNEVLATGGDGVEFLMNLTKERRRRKGARK